MLPLVAIAGRAGSGKDTLGQAMAAAGNGVCVALADPMKRLCLGLGFPEENLWGPSEKRNEVVRVRFDVGYPGASAYKTILDHAREVFGDNRMYDANHLLEKWFHDLLDKNETGELTARYALQLVGTEVGRAVDRDCWTNYTVRTAKMLLGGGYRYEAREGLIPDPTYNCDLVVVTDCRFRNELVGVKSAGGWSIQVLRPDTADPTGGVAGHTSETELGSIPGWFFDTTITNDRTREDLIRQGMSFLKYIVGVDNRATSKYDTFDCDCSDCNGN
jgi:hypothetical protein